MEDKKENKSSFPLPVILLISTFIAGGVFKYYAPLDSMRPAHNERRIEFHLGEEKILARMWQDPFQAVEKDLQNLKGEKAHSVSPSGFQPKLDLKDKRILILPVLTTAGNYAENIEKRLRSRYALLSALHVVGYRSKKASLIGVFKLKELEEKKAEVELKTADDICQQAKEKVKQSAERLRYIGNKIKSFEILKEESMERPEDSTDKAQRIEDKRKQLADEYRPVESDLKKAEAEEKNAEKTLEIAENKLDNLRSHRHPIPYEWFVPDPLGVKTDFLSQHKSNYDAILILWLGDEYFSKERIKQLRSLFEDIRNSIEHNIYNLKATRNSLEWLNELLSMPDFHSILQTKKKFPYSNTMNIYEPDKIRVRNRLILEKTYPEYAPNIHERKSELKGLPAFSQDEFIPPFSVNSLCDKIKILQLDIKVIGPSNSVILKEILSEARDLKNKLERKKYENVLNNIRIRGIEEKVNKEVEIPGNVYKKWEIIKDKLEKAKSRNEFAHEQLTDSVEKLEKSEGQVAHIYEKYKLENRKNELSNKSKKLRSELEGKENELSKLKKELNDAGNRLEKLRANSDGLYTRKDERVTEKIQQQEVDIIDLYIDDLYLKRVDLEKKIRNVTYEISEKNKMRNSAMEDIEQMQEDYMATDSQLNAVKEEIVKLQNIASDMSLKNAKDVLKSARNDLTETEKDIRLLTIDYNKVEDAKGSLDKLQKIDCQIQETISEINQQIKRDRERGLVMYSPWATTDPFLLLLNKSESVREIVEKWKKLQKKYKGNDIVSEILLDKTGVVLKRSIHTDQQLTDVLVNELVRRGVELEGGSSDHIVLISEWDSYYGRALPFSFAVSIEKYREKHSENKKGNSNSNSYASWPERIHKLTYMRGIDGMLPKDNNNSNSSVSKITRTSQKRDNSSNMGYFTPEFKQPLGQAQYDYMRRLVEVINRVPLNDPNGKPGDKVRAIGVLGSDIYDKLLILRALRGKFPNTIFFTNDMDARLFHHTELPWTRNLIVASSYGLQLQRSLQGDIPPFRNVYQSALFVSALQALEAKEDLGLKGIRPRIFEIGRKGPYDLTPIPVESSDFILNEFDQTSSVIELCKQIASDIDVDNVMKIEDIKADKNTTGWLNEFLRFPGFYANLLEEKSDIIRKIMNVNIFAKLKMQRLDIKRFNNLKKIIEETKGYRGESYYVLNPDEQSNIKKLNRLLLEELYPKYTPKINARETNALHRDRDGLWRNNHQEILFYIFFMFFFPLLLFGWLIYRRLDDVKSTDSYHNWKEARERVQQEK